MLHLPTLITERLCLRPFTLADAVQIHALSSDYEIARNHQQHSFWPRHAKNRDAARSGIA